MKSPRQPTHRELEEYVRLPATAKEVARRIFAAAPPPNPSLRKPRKNRARSPACAKS